MQFKPFEYCRRAFVLICCATAAIIIAIAIALALALALFYYRCCCSCCCWWWIAKSKAGKFVSIILYAINKDVLRIHLSSHSFIKLSSSRVHSFSFAWRVRKKKKKTAIHNIIPNTLTHKNVVMAISFVSSKHIHR